MYYVIQLHTQIPRKIYNSQAIALNSYKTYTET